MLQTYPGTAVRLRPLLAVLDARKTVKSPKARRPKDNWGPIATTGYVHSSRCQISARPVDATRREAVWMDEIPRRRAFSAGLLEARCRSQQKQSACLIASAQRFEEAPDQKPAGETIPKEWWSQTGSNRRPQACKASALPTELWPRTVPELAPGGTHADAMVGLGRLELPTSRLSSARSNQLSYKPDPPHARHSRQP